MFENDGLDDRELELPIAVEPLADILQRWWEAPVSAREQNADVYRARTATRTLPRLPMRTNAATPGWGY